MNNMTPVAQGTPSERETLDVSRWEDDGGQEAPTFAVLAASHHQVSSGRTQLPQELDTLASLTENSRPALDPGTDDRS